MVPVAPVPSCIFIHILIAHPTFILSVSPLPPHATKVLVCQEQSLSAVPTGVSGA